jgi:hypothetical protein
MLPPAPPPIHGPEAAPEPGPSLALARFTQLAVRGLMRVAISMPGKWPPFCVLARACELMTSRAFPMGPIAPFVPLSSLLPHRRLSFLLPLRSLTVRQLTYRIKLHLYSNP